METKERECDQISLAFAHFFLSPYFYFRRVTVICLAEGRSAREEARHGEIADTQGQPPDRCTVEDTSITRMDIESGRFQHVVV